MTTKEHCEVVMYRLRNTGTTPSVLLCQEAAALIGSLRWHLTRAENRATLAEEAARQLREILDAANDQRRSA